MNLSIFKGYLHKFTINYKDSCTLPPQIIKICNQYMPIITKIANCINVDTYFIITKSWFTTQG